MAPGRVMSYAYRYDDYTGTLIHQGNSTLTEATYAAFADTFLQKTINDNYYAGAYYDLAEAYVTSPEFAVSITSPADPTYVLPTQSVNLSASATRWTSPVFVCLVFRPRRRSGVRTRP